MKRWLVGGVAALAAGILVMVFFGFPHNRPVNGQDTDFAADRAPKDLKLPPFDGKRALGYLEKICDIGPRMSGTPGMKKQQDLIIKHFEGLGVSVEKQTFSAKQISQKNSVEMTNLIISFHPKRNRRVILCCHYDTRPIADQEEDPRKWREPFVSANDGGSGVAFLMEMGQHIKDMDLRVGVDFVIFDGEEYIFDRQRDKYFFGSEHFARTWAKKKQPDYVGAVLLDMIAGKGAKFPVEGHSWMKSRELVLEIWRLGRDLGCDVFANAHGERILDDHLALQNVGIPAIDIIDFDYPHWHRLSDTPANCAAAPMEQVAKVLSAWMQRAK